METDNQINKVLAEAPDGTAQYVSTIRHTFRLVAKQADMEKLDADLNALYEQLTGAGFEFSISYSSEKRGDEVFYQFNSIPDEHAAAFNDMLAKYSRPQDKTGDQTLKEAWYAKQAAIALAEVQAGS